MTTKAPELHGINAVVVGTFAPAMFHPHWFKQFKIFRDSELDSANIEVVHQDITRFVVGALVVQVQQTTLVLETNDSRYEPVLRDVLSALLTILEATRVFRLGINTRSHFKSDSVQKWHSLGDKLAPKEFWKSVIDEPGMNSLTIQGQNPHTTTGYIRVKVEPSLRVSPGVFIEVNNHFDFGNDSQNARAAQEIVSKKFNAIVSESVTKASKVFGLV